MARTYPSDKEIRAALVARANEFVVLTGCSPTEIGLNAVKDGSFIVRVQAGRDFRLKTYSRVMRWLDLNWPKPSKRARS